jgi:hypothetical protein
MTKMRAKAQAGTELSPDDACRLCDLARVPPPEHNFFRECVHGITETIWRRYRQIAQAAPSPALIKVAKAARSLHEAQLLLGAGDRALVAQILKHERAVLDQQFESLPRTAWQLDFIFSTVMGTSSNVENGRPPGRRGRKPGTVHNEAFQKLVRDLLLAAFAVRGKFTLYATHERGTLVEALNILRGCLPLGLVPEKLPFGTIQKIKNRFNESHSSG